MSDLINRQDAIDDVTDILETYKKRKRYEQVGALTAVISGLKQLPSAEPERKKGKWKDLTFGFGECSECGCHVGNRYTYNFCPKCGADMRGEENADSD